jgi:hypothetical protein
MTEDEEDEEREVEMISAVVETIEREGSSVRDFFPPFLFSLPSIASELIDTSFFSGHRLMATLGLLLRLTPRL